MRSTIFISVILTASSVSVDIVRGEERADAPKKHAAAIQKRVRDVEKKLIEYRSSEQFNRGRVTFRKTVIRSVGFSDEFEYRIEFDGESIRFDWRGRTLGHKRWGGWHQHVVTPSYYLRDYPNGTSVHKGRISDYKNVRQTYQIFHPRTLGTSLNTYTLAENGLHGLIGRSGRSEFAVAKEKLLGKDAVKIEFVLASPLISPKQIVRIVPEMGFAIVSAESNFRLGDKAVVSRMDAKYQKWGETWYPKKIDHQYVKLGKLEHRETITVTSAEFGVPIESSTFTIEGLGLAPGRDVTDTTKD